MMKIQEIFLKDIKREINGVIKVDQDADNEVYQELDEFVITNELNERFQKFYNHYNRSLDAPTDKMGIWIWGFFGSGKSHFLKILSYLLGNKEVHEKKAVSFFDSKVPDQFLLGEISRAAKYPTDAILFNIDSKSRSDSKTRKTAIVEVFMKVFNEHLGYSAEIAWLAELERKLDSENNYQKFMDEFEAITGKSWKEQRKNIYLLKDAFVKAIMNTLNISESSAVDMFTNLRNDYALSTEGFAELVKKYLDKKGKTHRIVFLIDEVGQYISSNSDLMLNLQTVVENLGTKCKGRAWVIVTSQEAIDELTKERFKDQDFSKIQGRFETLRLSSANTDEVIKRRLLEKKDFAIETLSETYRGQESILRNLITFSPKTVGMKAYDSKEDFTQTYPFVPYQFDLLQKVFECIRKFSHAGKHLSEGERSMLNAFHSAAIDSSSSEINDLVPFNAFYKTVETFLDSSITRIFTKAKDHLEPFDLEVLKVLFMIKYIKGFTSDVENIATLLISNVDENKIELRNKITASLSRLKQAVLIQQNGDEYDFLTDEEQDVNRGIKAMQIDYREIVSSAYGTLFTEIYTDKAYRHSKYNTYNFSRRVDDFYTGRQGEDLEIKFLTPDSNDYNLDETKLGLESSGGGLLIIKLPSDRTYLEEIEQIIKTEKYIKQKDDVTKSETVKNIINAKGNELTQRKKRVKALLIEAILNATLYASGEKLNIEESVDPCKRINKALDILVKNTFTYLELIKANIDPSNASRDLYGLLTSTQLRTDGGNRKAEDDVLGIIGQYAEHSRTLTMQELKDKYTKKPYGWHPYDIAGIVAKLFANNLIKLQYNGEDLSVEDKKVVDYLIKEKEFDRLIIRLKPRIDTSLIDNAKKLGQEIFGKHDLSDDGDELSKQLRDTCIKDKIHKLDKFLVHYNDNHYPGKDVIDLGIKIFKDLQYKKDAFSFLEELNNNSEAIATWKEEFNYVEGFFNNQRPIFDKGIKTLSTYKNNKYDLHNDTIIETIRQLKEIVTHDRPYSNIKDVPILCKQFEDQYTELLKHKKTDVENAINAEWDFVKDEIERNNLNPDKFIEPFNNLKTELQKAVDFNDVIALKDRVKTFSQRAIENMKEELAETQPPVQPDQTPVQVNADNKGTIAVQVRETKELVFVNPAKDVKTKQILETEEDVDVYMNDVGNYLKDKIRNNKRIRLS